MKRQADAKRRVVMLGGGTTGWMTVAALGRRTSTLVCRSNVIAKAA